MLTVFDVDATLLTATEGVDPLRELATVCRLQVLIADDSANLRKLVAARLESTGRFDLVIEAADGNEAIGLAELMQPDVVLLDLSMPCLDGLEALPLVLAVAPRARVIVMSGSPEDEMAAPVVALGAAGYIEKGPVMDVTGVIDAVLGSAS